MEGAELERVYQIGRQIVRAMYRCTEDGSTKVTTAELISSAELLEMDTLPLSKEVCYAINLLDTLKLIKYNQQETVWFREPRKSALSVVNKYEHLTEVYDAVPGSALFVQQQREKIFKLKFYSDTPIDRAEPIELHVGERVPIALPPEGGATLLYVTSPVILLAVPSPTPAQVDAFRTAGTDTRIVSGDVAFVLLFHIQREFPWYACDFLWQSYDHELRTIPEVDDPVIFASYLIDATTGIVRAARTSKLSPSASQHFNMAVREVALRDPPATVDQSDRWLANMRMHPANVLATLAGQGLTINDALYVDTTQGSAPFLAITLGKK